MGADTCVLYNLVCHLWKPSDLLRPIPHHGPGLSEAEDAYKSDSPDKEGADDGADIGYSDPINPSHYKRGGLESIDVIKAFTENLQGEEAFCTGNALKYLARWKEKGGQTDLSKARWYINRMLGDE